jgi:D-xylulose reductase
MVEPLAIGMHAAKKARIKPGDVAVVTGAGTIGMVTTLAALAGGCSKVIISDLVEPKLDLAATFGPVTPVNVKEQDLKQAVLDATDGWGADIVFEASGAKPAILSVFDLLAPGGTVVLVGMPIEPTPYDVVGAQTKEATVEHIFRYAHVYPRAVALMASGKLDVKPMITDTFTFEQSVQAIEFACKMPPTSVKPMVSLG